MEFYLKTFKSFCIIIINIIVFTLIAASVNFSNILIINI